MDNRAALVAKYTRLLAQHKELSAKRKTLSTEAKTLGNQFDKTEGFLNALQNCGQMSGELLRRLDDERLIVKSSIGPRYVVGCRPKIEKEKLQLERAWRLRSLRDILIHCSRFTSPSSVQMSTIMEVWARKRSRRC